MRFKKLLYTGFLLFSFLFFITISANETNAHNSACKGGSETVGYIVNCSSHAGKTSFTYRFSADLSSTYKNYTNVGLGRWNSTNIVKILNSPASVNLITSHGGPDTDTVAVTSSWKNPTTGHKTRWTLSYNRYVMGKRNSTQNNATATHELGHTIGLKDLKSNSNKNKLMYGYSTRTVYTIQTADKTGAREAVK